MTVEGGVLVYGVGEDEDERLTVLSPIKLAGVSLFTLSRRMGTSLAMIDATYGHLAPDAEEQERALLDAYDVAVSAGGG